VRRWNGVLTRTGAEALCLCLERSFRARRNESTLVQELGVDPSEKPSPWVAAGSSFAMFAIGAIVPLIPYLLGYESLWLGLAFGGLGLLIAGGTAARFTRKPTWLAALRQLAFGAIAIGATYVVGTLIGTAIT
jgi:VIT1/CCC1 family predicted Fe2+/Mn2+ transporter